LKEFANKAVQIGLSSDWPVVDLNPWDTLKAAIDPTNPHAMTFTDALWGITRGAALLGDPQAEVGLIQDGMLADFVIHESTGQQKVKDLTPSAPEQSRKIKHILQARTGVKKTFVAGTCVFGCS